MIRRTLLAASLMSLAACSQSAPSEEAKPDSSGPTPNAEPVSLETQLNTIAAGDHRSEDDKARDDWRNPAYTLAFFGLAPSMTVVEVWPGNGWYTNILAPYLQQQDGVLYAATFDPARSDRTRAAVERYEERFVGNDFYGDVRMTILGGTDNKIAPDASADMVLTFRNVHNWTGGSSAEDYFAQFYTALKPGGVLGVVEHRAAEEGESAAGYVKQSAVVALAEGAGFELEASSEINANPKDTRDHPFGVWTLPPTRRSAEARGMEDPDFDRAKYDAIGESDRMTLKFRKPIAADGALLE